MFNTVIAVVSKSSQKGCDSVARSTQPLHQQHLQSSAATQHTAERIPDRFGHNTAHKHEYCGPRLHLLKQLQIQQISGCAPIASAGILLKSAVLAALHPAFELHHRSQIQMNFTIDHKLTNTDVGTCIHTMKTARAAGNEVECAITLLSKPLI